MGRDRKEQRCLGQEIVILEVEIYIKKSQDLAEIKLRLIQHCHRRQMGDLEIQK